MNALLSLGVSRSDSAIGTDSNVLRRGLAWGSVGVVAFSLTLPTTQVAVRDLGPIFATTARAACAAALAAIYLTLRGARLPAREHLGGLMTVTAGVVIGFPLFTSMALRHTESGHGAVIVGLLPLVTALGGVLRTGERPSRAFWLAAGAGAGAVALFAIAEGQGLPTGADGLTMLAVMAAAAGYVEGARLSPFLGSDCVICWALMLSLPVVLPVLLLATAHERPAAHGSAWLCFAYTAIVSMFLGFFAWYRGLALGGVAKVSQLQLAQPLLTVTASVVLFRQHLDEKTLLGAAGVLLCVAAAQRARVRPAIHR